MLAPQVQKQVDALAAGTGDSQATVMNGMLVDGKGAERSPRQIAQRLLALTIAAVLVTANGILQALFDICEFPEYIEPLLQELDQVGIVSENGKSTLTKLDKMDSFLAESMRLRPHSLSTFISPPTC